MPMDFDQVAAAWGRWASTFERGAHAVSEQLVAAAHVRPGCSVLDLGTGPGEPAFTAAKVVGPSGNVVGIDISPAMIALARKRAEREGVGNVEFAAADAGAYNGGRTFDAIVSRFGLQFLPDLDAALLHYRASLRDGGRFAAATWGAPPDVPMISLPVALGAQQFGLTPPPIEGGPFALHDAAGLRQRFIAAGYRDVDVQEMVVPFPFVSASEYVTYMADVAPPFRMLLEQLAPAQGAALRADVEEAATARFSSSDGALRIPNRVIVISASSSA